MSTAVPILPPPLREGDRLTRDEFLRRWDAMPDLKHAELIDGVVHMPSPVAYPHNRLHAVLTAWLANYEAVTPGCETGSDGTWLMGPLDAPQPDLTLRIRPDHGGQSSIVNHYLAGAPELAVEVSHSTSARDLGAKANLYLRYGVREYLAVLTKPEVIWRENVKGRWRRIPLDPDGILRSRAFLGLWLDVDALYKSDVKRLLAVVQQGAASQEHTAFTSLLASRRK
ncbi:MAG: Uma2 family endonuclease [Bryobacterales bacterium]|nr:Uma2 family endonuclease [Bryobacterales bacterium]